MIRTTLRGPEGWISNVFRAVGSGGRSGGVGPAYGGGGGVGMPRTDSRQQGIGFKAAEVAPPGLSLEGVTAGVGAQAPWRTPPDDLWRATELHLARRV